MTETLDDRLLDAFDDCLTQMGQGESVADCLSRYPDLTLELRPMLEAAQAAVAASRVPHHVQMRSRARFLTAAAQKRPVGAGRVAGFVRRVLTTAITLFVGFLLGTTGLYYASAET